jgi:hypothetical protein
MDMEAVFESGAGTEGLDRAFEIAHKLEEREKRADAKLLAAHGASTTLQEMFKTDDGWKALPFQKRYEALMGSCPDFSISSCSALAKQPLHFLINILSVEVGQQLVTAVKT